MSAKQFCALVGVGLGGFLGGVLAEKKCSFPTASAASKFSQPKDVDTVDSRWLSEGASKSSPSRVSQIMKLGFPGMDNIRSFEDFVVSYDKRTRVPHWVFEHITKESVKHNDQVSRAKCDFFEDPSVHQYFRSTNADYRGSGFDRGHMAAAGNHKAHQRLVEETFVLSNMAPQVGKGFNRDTWNRLEKHARGLTKKYDNVYICTGPLFLPFREGDGKYYVKYQVLGKNNVAVPTHFFKLLVGESVASGHMDVECYLMPNKPIDDNAPLDAFRVPIDAVERSSGLLFLDRVPRHALRTINGKKPT